MNKHLTIIGVFILSFALMLGNASLAAARNWSASAAEFRTSRIIGADVHDRNGRKFGEIKDLVIDPQVPGRIIFAVVRPDHSMVAKDRFIAIPFSALSRRDSEHYVLNMDRDMIRRAPSFDEDHWPNLADRTWSDEVYRFFGQVPYWTERR